MVSRAADRLRLRSCREFELTRPSLFRGKPGNDSAGTAQFPFVGAILVNERPFTMVEHRHPLVPRHFALLLRKANLRQRSLCRRPFNNRATSAGLSPLDDLRMFDSNSSHGILMSPARAKQLARKERRFSRATLPVPGRTKMKANIRTARFVRQKHIPAATEGYGGARKALNHRKRMIFCILQSLQPRCHRFSRVAMMVWHLRNRHS